ncbi:MAG: exodeoxyribonuclease III [Fusobacteriaceae bacterium]
MKLVSWNVNGIRAVVEKGFLDFFKEINADFFSIQESKCQEGQITLELEGYNQYWNYAEKKGYSGTAIFTKHKPLSVTYDLGIEEHDKEGRVITLEYEKFFLVNVYTPNSGEALKRLEYRISWEKEFRNYLLKLKKQKPVIVCGDLNVAHEEIDLKNPKSNKKNAGFTEQERAEMTTFLSLGFVDSFRYLYPDLKEAYSWWSYRFNARKNNAGWRIDYFVVSEDLKENIEIAKIYPEIFGSDHCPVELVLNI